MRSRSMLRAGAVIGTALFGCLACDDGSSRRSAPEPIASPRPIARQSVDELTSGVLSYHLTETIEGPGTGFSGSVDVPGGAQNTAELQVVSNLIAWGGRSRLAARRYVGPDRIMTRPRFRPASELRTMIEGGNLRRIEEPLAALPFVLPEHLHYYQGPPYIYTILSDDLKIRCNLYNVHSPDGNRLDEQTQTTAACTYLDEDLNYLYTIAPIPASLLPNLDIFMSMITRDLSSAFLRSE